VKFGFRQGLLEGWFRVSVGFVLGCSLGLGFMDAWFKFLLVWFRVELNYCFVRVCLGVGLGFVLGLVWGLFRVALGFIQGRFRVRVYLGLV